MPHPPVRQHRASHLVHHRIHNHVECSNAAPARAQVIAGIVLLIGGKLAVMAAIGPMFGLSKLASVRSGLLLAPGEGGCWFRV